MSRGRRPGLGRLLRFVLSALAVSCLVAGLWVTVLVHPYLAVVARGVEGVIHAAGLGRVAVAATAGKLRFAYRDVLLRDSSVGTLGGISLTFNVVPLVALMVASAGVPWRARLGYLGVALLVAYATHVGHAAASFYVGTHAVVAVEEGDPLGWARVWSHYGITYAYVFWNVAGRMLTPFVLWGAAFPRVLFGPESLLAPSRGPLRRSSRRPQP